LARLGDLPVGNRIGEKPGAKSVSFNLGGSMADTRAEIKGMKIANSTWIRNQNSGEKGRKARLEEPRPERRHTE